LRHVGLDALAVDVLSIRSIGLLAAGMGGGLDVAQLRAAAGLGRALYGYGWRVFR